MPATKAKTKPFPPLLSAVVPGTAQNGLTWSVPVNGGREITAYKIYRATTSGAQVLVRTIPISGNPQSGQSYSTTDPGLVNGTTYYYEVTAVNAVGESNRSNEEAGTPRITIAPSDVGGGSNLQSYLNNQPTGASIYFGPGTFVLTGPVYPRAGQKLYSSVPAMVDGVKNTTPGAIFTGDSPTSQLKGYGNNALYAGVTVDGFVFRNFPHPNPSSGYLAALQCGDNWTVTNCEITANTQIGLGLGKGSTIVGNWIHHNGRYGYSGGGNATTPITDILIEDNEINNNNTVLYWNGNAGGTKIFRASRVVMRGNNVHDNMGAGLHCDTGVYDVTYEDNDVNDNWSSGIQHEMSGLAVIENNRCSGNAYGSARGQVLGGGVANGPPGLVVGANVPKSAGFGADIIIPTSRNIEITGNTVVAGVHGIVLNDQANRGNEVNLDGDPAVSTLARIYNVNVHDNDVTLPAFPGQSVPTGRVGMVGSIRPDVYKKAGLVRFTSNDYHVADVAAKHWLWGTSGAATEKTWTTWRAASDPPEEQDLRDPAPPATLD